MKRYNNDILGYEGKVSKKNFTAPGYNRYSFCNASEFQQVRMVPRNPQLEPTKFNRSPNQLNLSEIMVTNVEGEYITAADYFKSSKTDGLMILKDDVVLLEEYYDYYSENQVHLMMSVTKCFTGLMVCNEIKKGNLSREDLLLKFIPELKGSGFDKTTIGQLLDMQLKLKFSENYADANAEIWQYAVAMNLLDPAPDYKGVTTIREALAQLELAEDTVEFLYTTPIADVLNWVLERVTEKTFADNLEEQLFSKYGFEKDAQVVVDPTGVEIASGGLNLSLRDSARIGQILAHKGEYNGFKFLEDGIIDELVNCDDTYQERYKNCLQAKQKGRESWYYKDQVWVMNTEDNDFAFLGVYGQVIYVNLKKNITVVKHATNDTAGDANLAYQIEIIKQIIEKI